jgi:hypothetical protein
MRARAASFLRCLDHTQWHITVGRTPLNEGPTHRRDHYLTTHNTHKSQSSLSPVGFEPAIPASDQRQTLIGPSPETDTSCLLTQIPFVCVHFNINQAAVLECFKCLFFSSGVPCKILYVFVTCYVLCSMESVQNPWVVTMLAFGKR